MEQLLAAIQNGKTWADGFTRHDYQNTFKRYCQQYEADYTTAVQNSDDLRVLACDLTEALEAGWKNYRLWNRSTVRADEKKMIVTYLSPMLLGAQEPRCADFAQALCDVWGERWPNDPYSMADYQKIQDGFRHAILGIELRKK